MDFTIDLQNFSILLVSYVTFFAFIYGVNRAINLLKEV